MLVWQWHQLDHIQIICTSLQTDNHASTSPLSFYRPDSVPVAQPCQSTEAHSCKRIIRFKKFKYIIYDRTGLYLRALKS